MLATRRRFAAIAGAAALAAVPGRGRAAPSCGTVHGIADEWSLKSAEAAGLDPARLCALDGRLDERSVSDIHGLVVARAGALVYEAYRPGEDRVFAERLGVVPHDADTLHDIRSVTKSVTSLLVGIAVDRGLIEDIDRPVVDYLPEYADLRTADTQRIQLRHLLTMTSGLRWSEDLPYIDAKNSLRLMNEAPDPYRYVLALKPVHEPGSWWEYSSGNTMLLAAVLRNVTGQKLPDFAREALFGPLGITRVAWIDVPPAHEPAPWGGLRLRPRDLARIGQLVLDGGTWQGRRIVSQSWIDESTKPRVKGWAPFQYGYQWVVGSSKVDGREIPWIAGWGFGGQRLYIVPVLQLVVAITAGLWDTGTQDMVVLGILNRYVLPSVRG